MTWARIEWSTLTEILVGMGETVSLTVDELNDELEGSAELCEGTLLVNTDTITETEKLE